MGHFTEKCLHSLIHAFVILLVLKIGNSVSVETSNVLNPEGLASLEWGQHLQGLYEDKNHSTEGGKRILNQNITNIPYQKCIAPGDQEGHCRHLSTCVLEAFRKDFLKFMDYMCIIEKTYIGVCCPDDVELEDNVIAKNMPETLPRIATLDEKPIWDMEKDNGESLGVHKNVTKKVRAPRGCGTNTKSRTRVIGGRPADPKEWPWMAALLRRNTDQYCGGVLITDRHVLTAAHCVYKTELRDIVVRLGEYDFTRIDETRALDFRVIEIRVHEDFDTISYANDIAIVKLHRPTTFNSYIWPVCLPPVDLTFEDQSAIVTGWGTQYYGGPTSTILMEVAVPVWPQDKCIRSMTQRVTPSVMCAGAYEGGRDACQGDSGGPLLHQLGNGRWVNIGIVSWGIRCGEPGHPGIYTRVNSYLDWIFANAVF